MRYLKDGSKDPTKNVKVLKKDKNKHKERDEHI